MILVFCYLLLVVNLISTIAIPVTGLCAQYFVLHIGRNNNKYVLHSPCTFYSPPALGHNTFLGSHACFIAL